MYDACVDMEGLKVTVIEEEIEEKEQFSSSTSETEDMEDYYNQPEILTDEDRGRSEDRESVERKLTSDDRWKRGETVDVGKEVEERKSSERQSKENAEDGLKRNENGVIEKNEEIKKEQNGDVVKTGEREIS